VQIVRAALDGDVDLRAAERAGFGAVEIGLDLELLDRVYGYRRGE
jgi:hypothetical protein